MVGITVKKVNDLLLGSLFTVVSPGQTIFVGDPTSSRLVSGWYRRLGPVQSALHLVNESTLRSHGKSVVDELTLKRVPGFRGGCKDLSRYPETN